jgi:hypothetical protein
MDCLRNSPDKEPPSSIEIDCTYVTSESGLGIGAYLMCGLGIVACLAILYQTYAHRAQPVIKRSQPIFIYAFIVGAILMNITIVAYIGPNTDVSCLLRPWAFNLSATIMFAPLLMKLRRVNVLFNNASLKKVKVTNAQVISTICVILLVDILILVLWTIVEMPRVKSVSATYANVLLPVEDKVCTTGIANKFEVVMLAYKILLIAYGVYQAASAWNIQSDFSEAKHFAIAIYNITIMGGLSYFLSLFLLTTTGAGAAVILQCLGLFACSTLATSIIMIPKFLSMNGVMIFGIMMTSKSHDSSGSGGDEVVHPSRSNQSYLHSSMLNNKSSVSGNKSKFEHRLIPGKKSVVPMELLVRESRNGASINFGASELFNDAELGASGRDSLKI